MLAANADARRAIFVPVARDAKTVDALAVDLLAGGWPLEKITSVSIEISLSTIKTVIFLIASKLDFQAINPHALRST